MTLPRPTTDETSPRPERTTGGLALLRRALLGLVLLVTMVAGGAWVMYASVDFDRTIASDPEQAERRQAMAGVKRWALVRETPDVEALAQSELDLIVLDPVRLTFPKVKTRDAVLAALRQKPDGTRRLVLASLSIGEADRSQSYWDAAWASPATANAPPSWLGPEDSRRPGRFRVRYWDAGWLYALVGPGGAVVNQLIAAGYDGVHLERAEAHSGHRAERPAAEIEMVDLMIGLASAAREINPQFLVVMQNAEELLAHRRLRRTIDGVTKENLLLGLSSPGGENEASEIASSLHFLDRARRDGLPVLVTERLADTSRPGAVRRRLFELGFVPSLETAGGGGLPPE